MILTIFDVFLTKKARIYHGMWRICEFVLLCFSAQGDLAVGERTGVEGLGQWVVGERWLGMVLPIGCTASKLKRWVWWVEMSPAKFAAWAAGMLNQVEQESMDWYICLLPPPWQDSMRAKGSRFSNLCAFL